LFPVFFVSIAASALAFSQNFANRPNVPPGATEAFAAFDDQTNGFVEAQAEHVADAMQFNEHESLTQGLGPLYNADLAAPAISIQLPAASVRSPNCAPDTSTAMAFLWMLPEARFINSAALPGVPMPYVPEREFLRSFRTSLNILGDGYVEAIADETLEQIARTQSDRTRGRVSGQVIRCTACWKRPGKRVWGASDGRISMPA